MRNTFRKGERLSSKKVISSLFESGQSITESPLKLVYKFGELDTPYPCQIGVAVPKKTWKRAVDRNRLKRLIREAYRLNKVELHEHLQQKNQQCAFMIIYSGKKLVEYSVIQEKIIRVLTRLIEQNAENLK